MGDIEAPANNRSQQTAFRSLLPSKEFISSRKGQLLIGEVVCFCFVSLINPCKWLRCNCIGFICGRFLLLNKRIGSWMQLRKKCWISSHMSFITCFGLTSLSFRFIFTDFSLLINWVNIFSYVLQSYFVCKCRITLMSYVGHHFFPIFIQLEGELAFLFNAHTFLQTC